MREDQQDHQQQMIEILKKVSDQVKRVENTQVNHVEPVIVKTMLQPKLVTDVGIPDVYPQLNAIQKSMVVNSSPKLTHSD